MRLAPHFPAILPLALLAALPLLAGCGGDGAAALAEGRASLREGRPAEAVRDLRKASRSAPHRTAALAHLGLAYLRNGQARKAARTLERAAAAAGGDPRVLESLGHAYLACERFDEAAETFDRAFAGSEASARSLTCLAAAAFHGGRPERVHELLTEALAIDPLYPPALYNMGLFQRDRLEDRERAADYFRRYLDVAQDPRHEAAAQAYLAEYGRPRAPGPAGAGHAPLAATGAVAGALQPPPVAPVERMLRNAAGAVARADYDAALVEISRALALEPTHADALWELARLYDRHFDERYRRGAAQTYRRLAEQHPGDPRAARARERAAALASPAGPVPDRNVAEAQRAFSAAVRKHQQSEWGAAIDGYRQALVHDPDFYDAHLNLGFALKAVGRLAEAEKSFLQALRVKPGTTVAHYMLALVYRAQERNDQAVLQLDRTLELAPDDPRAHYLLGLIYRDQDREADAMRHFRRYVRLAPDEPAAAEVRRWIEDGS